MTSQDISDSQAIIRKFMNEGKFEEANMFLDNVSRDLTKSGQKIQLASL
jgi:hypothetical protein